MEEEIWKDVVGFENLYQISNLGQVKSLERTIKNRKIKSKIIKTFLINNKYLKCTLHKENKSFKFFIHRLVCLHFLPIIENKNQVNHIDKNSLNNNLNNLEWVSRIENMCHAYKTIKTSSKYTGVYWKNREQKWFSEISINNKNIYLGRFDNEEDAYQARVNYEIENNINNKYLW